MLGEEYLIGSEGFGRNIFNEDDGYVSSDVKYIDEKNFFYIPEKLTNAEVVAIKTFVERSIFGNRYSSYYDEQ